MEFPNYPRAVQLCEKIGSVVMRVMKEIGKSMGDGFEAANKGEAGLRQNAYIAAGDETAKNVAEMEFEVPNTPPQSWLDEHRK